MERRNEGWAGHGRKWRTTTGWPTPPSSRCPVRCGPSFGSVPENRLSPLQELEDGHKQVEACYKLFGMVPSTNQEIECWGDLSRE